MKMSKRELDKKVDRVYRKIFSRSKKRSLGLHGYVAELAFNTNNKELHIKELKQQIDTTRPYMEKVYGKGLIQEIADLPIKYRKLKVLSIIRELRAKE